MEERKKTCMILEDVRLNAEMLKQSLIHSNKFDEIISFSYIESAKDYISNNNKLPDVLFLDLYFSNGKVDSTEHAFIDLLDEFEDELAKVKICVVSATHQKKDMEKVSTYPSIIGFLEKPISDEKLAEILAKI